jgi:hypothetical protein
LGSAVGLVVILLNIDRLLLLLGMDPGMVTMVRYVVIALTLGLVAFLVVRGRRSRSVESESIAA